MSRKPVDFRYDASKGSPLFRGLTVWYEDICIVTTCPIVDGNFEDIQCTVFSNGVVDEKLQQEIKTTGIGEDCPYPILRAIGRTVILANFHQVVNEHPSDLYVRGLSVEQVEKIFFLQAKAEGLNCKPEVLEVKVDIS